MTNQTRKFIAKVLGDKVADLRDNIDKLTDDERYIALVNLNNNTKVSDSAWDYVLGDNAYFHIQTSKDFCDEVQSEIDHGASKKYHKYIDYVQKLGTKYFAPAYLGGLSGALHMMCQSIVIYLFNDTKTFKKTKEQYQEQLHIMFNCYRKRATKQGAWGNVKDQFSIQPAQMEADIEKPQKFEDAIDVVWFFKAHRPHFCNLLNDWLDVHYCLSALAHRYDDDKIKFSRDGVLDTYKNGYAVAPDDNRKTVLKNAKKSDLYSTGQFQKDCAKTMDNLMALRQTYEDGATSKVTNAREQPAHHQTDDSEPTVKATAKQPVQESLF